MERSKEGPLPIQRPEMLHPQEMPVTYLGIENRMCYPPEPLIKHYEVWLNWQACQLDTPHWWGELVAILGVEDLRRLAQEDLCLLPDSRGEV